MADLFNFETLSTSLHSPSKSLIIEPRRPEHNHAMNEQMLIEIESVLSWATGHIEIHSIFFKAPSGSFFSIGLDQQESAGMSEEKFINHLLRLQKITCSLFFLPQIIVMDLGLGVSNIAAEFCVGADIRLGQEKCILRLDHLRKGLVPFCGGTGPLSGIINASTVRAWVMSGKDVGTKELETQGLLHYVYDTQSPWEEILMNISRQAPVARIQTKRAFLESIMPAIDRTGREKEFALAALATGDWKKAFQEESPTFTTAREVVKILKEKNHSMQN